jgi:hypothetical protein
MSESTSSFDFTLVLSGFSELTDEVMDALYEAGCDDGLICLTKDGIPFIEFDRESTDLQSAIRSAIADVRKTPYRVVRVETPATSIVALINAELSPSGMQLPTM